MTKNEVINGSIALIQRIAAEKGIEVIDSGTGHGFENSFWNFTDNSGIPSVKAETEGFSIELRPFWTSPEIDIRRDSPYGEELLIFNFSDTMRINGKGKYEHTGNYMVREVRVDCYNNYRELIQEVYAMIDEIYTWVAGRRDK